MRRNTCFDKLSTNGFFHEFPCSYPLTLSLSKGVFDAHL